MNATTTPRDFRRLEAFALKATPGARELQIDPGSAWVVVAGRAIAHCQPDDDAAFIAEASADAVLDLLRERALLRQALENCRMYAARHGGHGQQWGPTILRFCAEAGIKASPLRETAHG